MRCWVAGSSSRSSASRASIESRAKRAWWRGSSRMSATQRTSSRWIRPVTRSLRPAAPTRAPAPRGPRRRSRGCSTSQSCSLVEGEVDQAVVQVVARAPRRAGRRAAARSAPRGTGAPGRRSTRPRCARRAPWSARWRRRSAASSTTRRALAAPAASHRPGRSRAACEPLADDLLLQEVLPDELLQPPAEVVLATRDQRGVRAPAAPAGGGTAPSRRTSRRSHPPWRPPPRR